MHIYKTILLFLVLYIYLFITKLDKYDKITIIYHIKHHIKSSNPKKFFSNTTQQLPISTIYNWLNIMLKILKIPFESNIYFTRFTFGYIYNKYISNDNFKYDKLFWVEIFNKNKINHPKLIAYNQNNIIKYIENIDESKEYVIKPIRGSYGIDVKKIKGNQVKEYLEEKKNVLIQEKLYDCIQKGARFFRYVTSYKGDKVVLIEYAGDDFIPNPCHGGKYNICHNLNCDSVSDKLVIREKMKKIMNQLSILHKKEFPKILSIGWDLMINCENSSKDEIKIYCLEGNSPHVVWYPSPEFDNTIIKYKQTVKDFYDENLIKY